MCGSRVSMENVGAVSGMVSVLHTFGSDLKYHLHCHSLITFGGLRGTEWVWPRRRKKIASFRAMSGMFRTVFMKGLHRLVNRGDVQ